MINRVFNKAVFKLGDLSAEEQKYAPTPADDFSMGGWLLNVEQLATIQNARAEFPSLKAFCRVIPVLKQTGEWVYVDSDAISFQKVTPAATHHAVNPTVITYSVDEFIMLLALRNSWLYDLVEQGIDIVKLIATDIARAQVSRENQSIVDLLNSLPTKSLSDYADLCTAVISDLPSKFFNAAKLITNTDGLRWLLSLKDGANRPLFLPSERLSFRGKDVIVLPVDDLPTVNGKAPLFVGDLEHFVLFFERQPLMLNASKEPFFAIDATSVRCFFRFGLACQRTDAVLRYEVSVP